MRTSIGASLPAPTRKRRFSCNTRRISGLHIRIELADFVQKQHAPLGCQKKTAVVVAGASECAPDMTEKFAFRDTGIDGRAIDGNERALTSLRVQGVERRGKKLLAGSGFPGDQYREITQLAHADKITERRQQRFAVPNYAVRTCQLSNPAFFVAQLLQGHEQIPECGQQSFLEIGTLAVQQVASPGEQDSTPRCDGPSCYAKFMRNDAQSEVL